MLEERLRCEAIRLQGEVEHERDLRLARREDDQAAWRERQATLSRMLEQFSEQVDGRIATVSKIVSDLGNTVVGYVRKEDLERSVEHASDAHEGLDRRVARIENWQARMVGALVFASVVVPLITALVVYLLTRHAEPISR